MSLSKVGSGQSYDNGGSTWVAVNLNKDTGTAAGDLVIIPVYWYENGSDSGLTPITDFDAEGSNVYSGSGTTESRCDIFTRPVTGSEGSLFSVARGAPMYACAQILTLRGASTLSVVSVTAGTPVSGATAVEAPSVSITATQAIVCVFALSDPPLAAYSDPSGMTLGISEASDDTNTGRVYYESPGAGTTGVRELSWSGGSGRDAIGITIIIEGANGTAPAVTHGFTLPKAHARRDTRFLLRSPLPMPRDVGPKVPTPFAPFYPPPMYTRQTPFMLRLAPPHFEFPEPEAPSGTQYVPLLAQRNVRHSGRH